MVSVNRFQSANPKMTIALNIPMLMERVNILLNGQKNASRYVKNVTLATSLIMENASQSSVAATRI